MKRHHSGSSTNQYAKVLRNVRWARRYTCTIYMSLSMAARVATQILMMIWIVYWLDSLEWRRGHPGWRCSNLWRRCQWGARSWWWTNFWGTKWCIYNTSLPWIYSLVKCIFQPIAHFSPYPRRCVSSGGAPTPLAHWRSWWWKFPTHIKVWS